ncbi:hypothetical protein [Spiroplasma alleghenense]|uniref:Uncharacterized protein n=1 Tax=Spiroplasma alleghenense TaxID=216931 RepID=A0A345Z4E4_9MOLU|nr:hypothetical protein [Spiroplasma alleghenense]AXK51473.1 hypothetical protein SALLE_v1c08030 [Spiroplasma alleghenense]
MKSKIKIVQGFIFKETFKSWGLMVFTISLLLSQVAFNLLIINSVINDSSLKQEEIFIIVNVAFIIGWILFYQIWFNQKFFGNHFRQEIIRIELSSFVTLGKSFSIRLLINHLISIILIFLFWLSLAMVLLVRLDGARNLYLQMTTPIFITALIINSLFCGLGIILQMGLPKLFTTIFLVLFSTSLAVSNFSANLHFQSTKKKETPPDNTWAVNLNRQTISIDEVVNSYHLSETNIFMEELLKSFEFWDYAFKKSDCQHECIIEDENKNEVYSAIFNDYLFLDIDERIFGTFGNQYSYEINWKISDDKIEWENEMIAKKLHPLETFYYVNQSLKNYYQTNKFSSSRVDDWTNSLFNLERSNLKPIHDNPFNNNAILKTLIEISQDQTLSPYYSNEDIIEVYEVANEFINNYSYYNNQSISPLDLNLTNKESFFYNNELYPTVNQVHKDFQVSSGERILTGSILSMIRNAWNYNFDLWNNRSIKNYVRKQRANVYLNYMSQFWIMNNFGQNSNRIEYHKSNAKIANAANKYYSVKINEDYDLSYLIVRNQTNEYTERIVKIDTYKKPIIQIWGIYLMWTCAAMISISLSYLIFYKKISRRR